MKIGAVINYKAGTLSPQKVESRLEEIKLHLKDKVSKDCLAIVSADQVVEEIQRIKNLGIDILIVGGGDGTISSAARLVHDTDITLAILALGTRNHFARDLGIPLDPVESISIIDRLNIEIVDLGEVNGHIFINNATIGLYPKIVEKRTEKNKIHGWRKWRAHMYAALIVGWRFPRIRLIIDDESKNKGYSTPFLFVGNNEYQGGLMSDSSRTTLKDGKLWLCTARASSKWALLLMAFQMVTKGIEGIKDIETKLLTSVTVRPKRKRVTVAIDGENIKMKAPLHFNIRAKSLKVIKK